MICFSQGFLIKILFNSVNKSTVGACSGGKKRMKRTALALTLISALLISLAAGVLVVKEAKANAFFIFKAVTPIPGTIPPIITISSPENNTAYEPDNFYLSFNITKPEPPIDLESGLSSIRYSLDNNDTGLYYCNHYNSRSPPGIPGFSYSKKLSIPEGNHMLAIYVGGVVLPGNMTIYSVGSTSTVFFTIGTNSEQKLESIPEFPSWIVLPLTMTATLIAAVAKRRRL